MMAELEFHQSSIDFYICLKKNKKNVKLYKNICRFTQEWEGDFAFFGLTVAI